MNRLFFARLYEARLQEGRKEFCPRVGVYKPLAVSKGIYYGKPTLMMKAHWRPSRNDCYVSDFIVDVQLGSIIKNASRTQQNQLDERGLIGKEIVVHTAHYNQCSKYFSIKFELHPIGLNVKEVNFMLEHGNETMFDSVIEKCSRKYWF